MPLYGHELAEEINPLEAGLRFAVKLKKAGGFIGIEALQRLQEQGLARRLCSFTVPGKRVARQGMQIFAGDDPVGAVTSGAPSPTLGLNVAMGYVDTAVSDGASVEVEIRGKRVPLTWHGLPFYKRAE